MPDLDDDLLARLNTLRKSHVSSDNSSKYAEFPKKSTSIDANDDDNLAARFRRLTSSTSNNNLATEAPPDVHTGCSEELGSALPQSEAEWNEEDDRTLDELLRDIGPEDQWKLDPEDPKKIGKLLDEAQKALSLEDVEQSSQNNADYNGIDTGESAKAKKESMQGSLPDTESEEISQHVAEQDESDAEDVVARALIGAEVDKRHELESTSDLHQSTRAVPEAIDDLHADPSDQEVHSSLQKTVEFPSAPLTLPDTTSDTYARASTSSAQASPSINDLAARLARLSTSPSPRQSSSSTLPSVPSFSPSKKSIRLTKARQRPSKRQYSEAEIDSWCIICCDDATVKCLGCDGDLYCAKCWREGHKGESAGYEEKMHRAVEMNRD